MSILTEFEEIRDALEQINAAIDVRRRLRGIYSNIVKLDIKVEFYKANTGFDDIPAETKAALNRFYQLTLQLKTAFENDADFDSIIGHVSPPI